MVNVMGPIPAFAAVETPTIVDGADAKPAPLRSAVGLRVRNPLARVLCYFPAASKKHLRKTALALDS